jgi:hypothetical protein
MPIQINGSGTITGITAGGYPDATVTADDLAATLDLSGKTVTLPSGTGGKFASYAILAHVEATGTEGGGFVGDTWNTRPINTEIADPDGIVVTISSNQFTLNAGTYLIEWEYSFYKGNDHTNRLYDATNSAVIQAGLNSYGSSAYGGAGNTSGVARVSPTGSTAYEIQMYPNSDEGGNGFGRYNRATGYTGDEVYLFVKIYKEA